MMINRKLERIVPLLCALPWGEKESPLGTLIIGETPLRVWTRHVSFHPHNIPAKFSIDLDCESNDFFSSFSPPDLPEAKKKRVWNAFVDVLNAYISSLPKEDRARLLANCFQAKEEKRW